MIVELLVLAFELIQPFNQLHLSCAQAISLPWLSWRSLTRRIFAVQSQSLAVGAQRLLVAFDLAPSTGNTAAVLMVGQMRTGRLI